ncbi:MAG: MFS transporter [Chloroflexota bacterium]
MSVTETSAGVVSKGIGFLKSLPQVWRITALRSCLNRFFYQMVLPYLSIYTRDLGASATQLGMVNSIGMGFAGLLGPFTGTLIDRMGPKRIYLVGITFLGLSYLVYGLARSWPIIILAMLFYWLGFETSQQGCTFICSTSLSKETRATAMALCETFAMGLMGMLGPLLGAALVTRFGGVNLSGIRPLFFVALFGMGLAFLLILTQLTNLRWGGSTRPANFFQGLSQVVREGQGLRRFLVVASLTYLPQGMVIPFSQVFARDAKLASAQVLGWMVTGFSLTPFLMGIPVGRMADRFGRKSVLYITGPLFWASLLMLIWAPHPVFLVLAGMLQGFYSMNMVLTTAISYEIVPKERMGRWIGILRFFRMLTAASAAWIAGFISDKLGMQYIFLTVLGLDVLIRMPLLITMPETLRRGESGR